jgi:hypothetical protein
MRPAPPRLRSGLYVVRRDDRHLQVGLDPPTRLVVPDEPEVRALLADLAAGQATDLRGDTARRLLRDLAGAGMLDGAPPGPRAPVAVAGTDALVEDADRLLRAAGVPVTEEQGDAAVVLVLSDGEPARDVVDDQVRAGRAHLVLAGDAAGYRVGPFVRPGETACLRCVDAHRGEHDPRRAMVVEQLAGRPLAAPDPVVQTLAVAWAVREVRHYLDGHRPVTWSAEVALLDLPEPRRTTWTRHPHCGCSWADGLGAGD